MTFSKFKTTLALIPDLVDDDHSRKSDPLIFIELKRVVDTRHAAAPDAFRLRRQILVVNYKPVFTILRLVMHRNTTTAVAPGVHGIIAAGVFIVVDSGSTDGTLAIVSHFPIQLLTIAPDEFTFGRSLNLGCNTATGEFIVIVSAHCYPLYRDWLKRLLAPFSDPKVGLVYGRQRGNEQTKHSEHRIYAKWFPSASDLDQRQPFCNNANAAIRRAFWQEQPYDETLTGLEDIAWAHEVMGRGYKRA